MQAVLRLIEHNGLRPIDDVSRHFRAAVRGQAMHEDGVFCGSFHDRRVDLIGLQQVHAFCRFLLTHRDPDVGDDAIGSLGGLARIFKENELAAFRMGPVDQIERRLKFFRRCNMEGEAVTNGGMNPRRGDIVAVADPRNQERLNRPFLLLERQHIG